MKYTQANQGDEKVSDSSVVQANDKFIGHRLPLNKNQSD